LLVNPVRIWCGLDSMAYAEGLRVQRGVEPALGLPYAKAFFIAIGGAI